MDWFDMKNLIRIVFEIYLTRRKKSRLYLAYLLFSGLTKPMNSVLSKIKGPSIRVHGGGWGYSPFFIVAFPLLKFDPPGWPPTKVFRKCLIIKMQLYPKISQVKLTLLLSKFRLSYSARVKKNLMRTYGSFEKLVKLNGQSAHI